MASTCFASWDILNYIRSNLASPAPTPRRAAVSRMAALVKTKMLVWIIVLFSDWKPSFVAKNPEVPSTLASRGISTPKRFHRASSAEELLLSVTDMLSNTLRGWLGLRRLLLGFVCLAEQLNEKTKFLCEGLM